ncbi:MAG: hypothetical protein PHF44_01275 [Candidatus Pacebacteria bacterium]|nr:hypothetical protein [Candidatus Paceibacterota bacterium]
MNKNISSKKSALIIGIFLMCFAVTFYIFAWTEPTAPPPGDNVSAPINVGTSPQAKAGRISATEFYDYNDANYYLNPNSQSALKTICLSGTCRDTWPAADWTIFDYEANFQLYATAQTYSGNLGGLTGADVKCAAAANKPAGFTTYKAIRSTDVPPTGKCYYNSTSPSSCPSSLSSWSFANRFNQVDNNREEVGIAWKNVVGWSTWKTGACTCTGWTTSSPADGACWSTMAENYLGGGFMTLSAFSEYVSSYCSEYNPIICIAKK